MQYKTRSNLYAPAADETNLLRTDTELLVRFIKSQCSLSLVGGLFSTARLFLLR